MAKPVKFQDRGVYIGFETQNLGNMRCRPSKVEGSVYEALISNWAGDSALGVGGDLVMPFLDVLEWAELSERDKALHASVSQYGYKTEGYIDPQSMREIRFETDMAFADPILRMRAVEELRIESVDSQNTYFEILSIFARKYGATIDNRELKYVSRNILQQLARENPEDVLRLTREITKAAAEHGEITPEILSARLDFYSSFAAPICSILDKDSRERDIGYLSRQLGALEDLMNRLEDFRAETNKEIEGFITSIQDNADKFIEFALGQATAIQLLIVDDRSYTHDDLFKELKGELYENRMHIAYALDGWEQHYVGWKKLQHDSNEIKEDFIIKLFRIMPQPTREIEATPIGYDIAGAGSRVGTVRMMHSWDSESEDIELKNRVAAGKFNKAALEIVNSDRRSQRRVERSAGRDTESDY